MPRHKEHPEFAHLDAAEYQRAVNRLNAKNSYRRKQVARLRAKLAELEGTPETSTEKIIEQN